MGLENCQISNENLEKSIDFNFEKLTYLNLNNNIELGDNGLVAILSKLPKNIEYLFCANCSLSNEISQFLKKNQENYQLLKYLNLRGNQKFQNEGLAILATCTFFKNLKFLNLSECGLDDESVKILLGNKPEEGFSLRDLRLAQNKITPEFFKILFENFEKNFKFLEKFAMGSYECMEEFDGKTEMEKKGILVVSMIGDNFD